MQCDVAQNDILTAIAQNQTCLNGLIPSKSRLINYSGHKITPVVKASFKCEHKNECHKINFQIISEDASSLLIRKICLEMRPMQRIMTVNRSFGVCETGGDILDKYPDLFTGLGCIKSTGKHHTEVDPSVEPVVHPPRKVLAALRSRI